MSVALPVAMYLLSLRAIYARLLHGTFERLVLPVAAIVVLLAALAASPVLAIGLVLAVMVGTKVLVASRESPPVDAPGGGAAARH